MHGLNFEPEHIEMCCLRCHEGAGNVIIKTGYHGEQINWDDFFNLKKKFIEDNKRGVIDPRCKGCFNLVHKDWDDEERYFSFIHFNHWTHCNSKCMYCYTDFNKEFYNKMPHYNVLPIIKDIFQKGLFRHGGEITFAGGEPTILEEFEELIDFMVGEGVSNITIHTSGIKFSPALARGIAAGQINVVVSADSGCTETYKKVKRFDHFNKVWKTTAKYAAAQKENSKNLVSTKFIFIPGFNDSMEEVESWLQQNVKAKTNSVVIDIEHEWFKLQREKHAMPDHIKEQIKYIQHRASELGLYLIVYNSARYLLENEQDFTGNEMMPNPYVH